MRYYLLAGLVLFMCTFAGCGTEEGQQQDVREQQAAAANKVGKEGKQATGQQVEWPDNEALIALAEQYAEEHLGTVNDTNGRSHCACELMGQDTYTESKEFYLWTVCQEYVGTEQKGAISSFPMKAIFRQTGGETIVSKVEKPGDGSTYTADVRNIFPAELVKTEIIINNPAYLNDRYKRLEERIREKVNRAS